MAVEYVCDGCGRRQAGGPLGGKPAAWFESQQEVAAQGRSGTERRAIHACSRECIQAASDRHGAHPLVAPW